MKRSMALFVPWALLGLTLVELVPIGWTATALTVVSTLVLGLSLTTFLISYWRGFSLKAVQWSIASCTLFIQATLAVIFNAPVNNTVALIEGNVLWFGSAGFALLASWIGTRWSLTAIPTNAIWVPAIVMQVFLLTATTLLKVSFGYDDAIGACPDFWFRPI